MTRRIKGRAQEHEDGEHLILKTLGRVGLLEETEADLGDQKAVKLRPGFGREARTYKNGRHGAQRGLRVQV
jgi:hypothetical protein